MKFGKQLQRSMYMPWQDKYLQYGRFKRLIKRQAFLRDQIREQLLQPQPQPQARSTAQTEGGDGNRPPGGPPDANLGRKIGAINKKNARSEPLLMAALLRGAAPMSPTSGQEEAKGHIPSRSPMTMPPGTEVEMTRSTERTPLVQADTASGKMKTLSDVSTASMTISSRDRATSEFRGEDAEEQFMRDRAAQAARQMGLQPMGRREEEAIRREEEFSEALRNNVMMTHTMNDWDKLLDLELHKVNGFYVGKLAELSEQLTDFQELSMGPTDAFLKGSQFSNLARLYAQITALKTYAELNRTGFRKILKKHDKVLGTNLEQMTMSSIDKMGFVTITEPLQTLQDRVEGMVSRDLLLQLQKQAGEQVGTDPSSQPFFRSVKPWAVALATVTFTLLLCFEFMECPTVEAHRCLAMLAFLTIMWLTEAIPYFATALCIPILVVMLRIMEDEDSNTLDNAEGVARKVLGLMVNNVTILILGGYSISAAFSRCGLELQIAAFLQRLFGHHPKVFGLSIMLLGLFLSMWISNHTAPVLCVTILTPILRDLPIDSPFAKFLLLGLAFACNFGGMMTPISSMQNALAVNALQNAEVEVGFGEWIAVATPFCVVGVVLAWLVLIAILKPDDVQYIPVIVHKNAKILTHQNMLVLFLSLGTILLWSTISTTRVTFGDLGIIALIFMTIMFGSGFLTQVDFNSFSWHMLFLLGGGNVLGKAVAASGLLDWLVEGILDTLPRDNRWLMLVLVLFVAMVIATFVSHTVAAIILMPLVVKIGVDFGMAEALGVSTAFAVSAAMAFPFSSFPNVNSLLVVDASTDAI
eukprot:CAMPEP_0113945436 /NCGR_PEP_ID=MMETSP1339-20121228/45883_1 /TAXON_ID=94617 /ORGANISM="Fibrocapsa japonica" /LENGTH=810 /DNA_ID=CAMNT_0000951017 /DNA_START=58 /DNA_END=2491 /DNA_ORIENTATION=- /assembly_acc=CAM_ASM_000762